MLRVENFFEVRKIVFSVPGETGVRSKAMTSAVPAPVAGLCASSDAIKAAGSFDASKASFSRPGHASKLRRRSRRRRRPARLIKSPAGRRISETQREETEQAKEFVRKWQISTSAQFIGSDGPLTI